MLILKRKQDQTIVVDGPCLIKIVSVTGNAVKLGFDAERTTTITRSELGDRRRKPEGSSVPGETPAA